VNARTKSGATPLHVACKSGNATAVRLLIEAGADPEAKNNFGHTPYDMIMDSDHGSAFELISETFRKKSPKSLLRRELLRALDKGDEKAINALTDQGADIEARDRYGYTPLGIACWNALPLNTVRLLLSHGADVTKTMDDKRSTPLHRASAFGGDDLADLLIRHGADVNARDWNGNTPLHWACENGNIKTTKLLLDHGADPSIQNMRKKTPAEMMDERTPGASEIKEMFTVPRDEPDYCAPRI